MTDGEKKEDKKDPEQHPDPVEDLRAGLGLLFRAARGAVDKIPTHKIEELVKEGTQKVGKAFHKLPADKVEEVVKDSATEIGRAMGHVASTLGKGFEDLTKQASHSDTPPPPPEEKKDEDKKDEDKK
jgi:hypothetical protein